MGRESRQNPQSFLPEETSAETALRKECLREMRRHIADTCHDRVLLLSIVAHGVHDYLRVARATFGKYQGANDAMFYEIFAFFQKQAGEAPIKNLDRALAADAN